MVTGREGSRRRAKRGGVPLPRQLRENRGFCAVRRDGKRYTRTSKTPPEWFCRSFRGSFYPRKLYPPRAARALRAAGFFPVFGADEDLARLCALPRTDDAVLLHHVDEARGLRIAEARATLQERDPRRAPTDAQPHAVP